MKLESADRIYVGAGPLGERLGRLLEAARRSFPLAGAVVRGPGGETLGASAGAATRPVPTVRLDADTLLPAGSAGDPARDPSAPLPAEGARLALVVGQRQIGWLDLYGGGGRTTVESRRALAAVSRALAALIAAGER